MANINWPATMQTGAVAYGIEYDVQITVARDGRIRTYGLPGARWTALINFEPEVETMQRPAIEALVVSLQGGANRLVMQHLGRPVPNGTMRGTPTLQNSIAAGAVSANLTGVNGTLKKGDLIGFVNQVVMITADTSPSSGNMTVAFSPPVRAAYNAGQAIVWNKPTMTWVPRSATAGPFPYAQGGVRPPISLELVEA